MRWKMLDAGPPATYAIILATGDEVTSVLGRIVREQKIEAGSLTGIGAFERRAGVFRVVEQGVQAHPGR